MLKRAAKRILRTNRILSNLHLPPITLLDASTASQEEKGAASLPVLPNPARKVRALSDIRDPLGPAVSLQRKQ